MAKTRQEFEQFHQNNPLIYAKLVEFSREVLAAGYAHCGIRMLWERLRWFVHFEVVQEDYQFKLNDHYKEYYSRLIMAQEPDLADFFSLRRSIADKAA